MKQVICLLMLLWINNTSIYAQRAGCENDKCGDGYGEIITNFNGLAVFSNGSSCTGTEYGCKQCTEFIERYYDHTDWTGNANVWFYQTKVEERHMVGRTNGGSIPPVIGNIPVFTGSKYGHVSLVYSVDFDKNEVKIIDQNRDVKYPTRNLNLVITGSNDVKQYTVASIGGSYTLKGWLSVKVGYKHDGSYSQAVIDAYNVYDEKLGWPVAIEYTRYPYLSEWGSSTDPNTFVWAQFFMQPDPERDRFDPDGVTAIILNENLSPQQAFVVQGGFLKYFKDNDGSHTVGRPLNNEYQHSNFSIPDFGTVHVMQDFENDGKQLFLAWNGTYIEGSVKLFRKSDFSEVEYIVIGQFPSEGIEGFSEATIKPLFEAMRDEFMSAYGINPTDVVPYDNGGSAYVHKWEHQGDWLIVQDVLLKDAGLTHEKSLFVLSGDQTAVYIMKEGFYWLFMEHDGLHNVGVPLGNESLVDSENGIVIQRFDKAKARWDASTGTLALTTYTGDPISKNQVAILDTRPSAKPVAAAKLASDQTEIWHHGVRVGYAPLIVDLYEEFTYTYTAKKPGQLDVVFSFNVTQDGFLVIPEEDGIVFVETQIPFVWPGDTNNDRRVSIADVLPIGVYWHESGPMREVGGCGWNAQTVTLWDFESAMYADADGSGQVDAQEISCIGLNWGKTLSSAKPVTLKEGNGSLDYAVHENPAMYDITVHVRDVENLFGISFIVNYVPIDDISGIEANVGDLFGEDSLFFVHTDYDTGEISVAISRKNGQLSVNGNGIVTQIKVPRSSSQAIQFKIVEIQGNDSQGNSFTLVSEPATAIQNGSRIIPQEFLLSQSYPNPFNSNAVVRYELPKPAMVQLTIYDILGQPIHTLVKEQQSAGVYEVRWDGRDDKGKEAGSGLYLYRLNTETYHQTRRMVLLR